MILSGWWRLPCMTGQRRSWYRDAQAAYLTHRHATLLPVHFKGHVDTNKNLRHAQRVTPALAFKHIARNIQIRWQLHFLKFTFCSSFLGVLVWILVWMERPPPPPPPPLPLPPRHHLVSPAPRDIRDPPAPHNIREPPPPPSP